MKFKEDVDSQLILTIGAISGFMVIVSAIGLQAWYMTEERREVQEKSLTSVNYELTNLQREQIANITTARTSAGGPTTVPIDQAMALLIQNNGKLPATQPARQ